MVLNNFDDRNEFLQVKCKTEVELQALARYAESSGMKSRVLVVGDVETRILYALTKAIQDMFDLWGCIRRSTTSHRAVG